MIIFLEILSRPLISLSLYSFPSFLHWMVPKSRFSGPCSWLIVIFSVLEGNSSPGLSQIHCWYVTQNEPGKYLERLASLSPGYTQRPHSQLTLAFGQVQCIMFGTGPSYHEWTRPRLLCHASGHQCCQVVSYCEPTAAKTSTTL